MTTQQLQENFAVRGSSVLSIIKEEKAKAAPTADAIREKIAALPDCVLKDYTRAIEQKELYLRQKMFYFYALALLFSWPDCCTPETASATLFFQKT